MDRFDDRAVLSTSDVARLLSIHPSTVKRWSDGGELPAAKTDGGHRRFHLDDVLEGARSREVSTFLDGFEPYHTHVWTAVEAIRQDRSWSRFLSLSTGWIARGRHRRVGLLVETLAAHPEVDLVDLVDRGIFPLLGRVSDAWREGRLGAGEEHLVAQTVTEALLRSRKGLSLPDSDEIDGRRNPGTAPGSGTPTAVVAALSGNGHGVAALGARLVLERAGWNTLFLGAAVPVEDIASVQRARRAEVVCIARIPTATVGLARSVRVLAEMYDPARPFALALLGESGSELPGAPARAPFVDLGSFSGVADLAEAVGDGFGRPRSAAGAGPLLDRGAA